MEDEKFEKKKHIEKSAEVELHQVGGLLSLLHDFEVSKLPSSSTMLISLQSLAIHLTTVSTCQT